MSQSIKQKCDYSTPSWAGEAAEKAWV